MLDSYTSEKTSEFSEVFLTQFMLMKYVIILWKEDKKYEISVDLPITVQVSLLTNDHKDLRCSFAVQLLKTRHLSKRANTRVCH